MKTFTMTLVALLLAAPLLGACQTTAGVGKDLAAAGKSIDKSATKHAP